MRTIMQTSGHVLLLFVFIFSGCTSSMEADSNASAVAEHLDNFDLEEFPVEEVSTEEINGLVFMREEEKLAHDVYIALYAQWGGRVFSNIAVSEQRHTDAVKSLLERYQIADPFIDSLGVFTDGELQKLYADLMALGSQSFVEALKVGALVEEVDILDLREEMENSVDNQDILFVYQQLEAASHNHLRAFVRNLNRQGVVYEPQKLSEELYQSILNGE